MEPETRAPEKAADFIREIVRADVAAGKNGGQVVTRFPPEPNGFLHIGHAKSIHLNFGLAQEFDGTCNLRFDDTNPETEDELYVRSIQEDVRWLGFDWASLRHASDYFEVFYLAAEKLIRQGDAFVCDLSADEVREYRGTLTEPGRWPRRGRRPCSPVNSLGGTAQTRAPGSSPRTTRSTPALSIQSGRSGRTVMPAAVRGWT